MLLVLTLIICLAIDDGSRDMRGAHLGGDVVLLVERDLGVICWED